MQQNLSHTQKPVESTVDEKTFNICPGRLLTMRKSNLVGIFSQQQHQHACQPEFSHVPHLNRKERLKEYENLSSLMARNDSYTHQRKSATRRPYAAAIETRDVLYSHLHLSITADCRLAPEQSSETDNKYQTTRCTSSETATVITLLHPMPQPIASIPNNTLHARYLMGKDCISKQLEDKITKVWPSSTEEQYPNAQLKNQNTLDFVSLASI